MAARAFPFRRAASLPRDRRGAVAPMVAVLGMSLLLAGGLALDVGLYRWGNRDLRAATEAAALAAAMDPAQAEARARDYLTRNGYDPGVLRQVTIGRYCADSALAPDRRFDPTFTACPGGGAANAVRIRTAKPSRRFLTGALGERVLIPELAATATATRIDEAGVEVSSGLVTVTNSLVGAVNDLLGALLGVKLRLSAADIEAMMGGNVDAGLFFDALARRAGHDGTYGDLVAGSHGLQDIALSAADAAGSASTAAALRLFAGQVGNGYRVPLNGLFGLGVWRNMPVGEADAQPALRAGLNAYQLVAYAVQAGPGVIDASDAVSLAVPGSTAQIAADRTMVFGPGGGGTIGSPQAPGQPETVGNGSQVGATIGTLAGSLAAPDGLDIRILGLCLPVVCAAQASLVRNALLPALVAPVTGLVGSTADPLLDNVLAALGIQLGHATVWVTGARCGVPVLV